MKNHENIMKKCLLIEEELTRKEQFRKSVSQSLTEYDFTTIKNLFEIEEKTENVIKDTLVDIANKSMKKTDIYYYLEKENLEEISQIIEDANFKYELYYINQYNNLIRDIVFKFWKPKDKLEYIVKELISKGMKYSSEKTIKTCILIKEINPYWEVFLDNQILHYKLIENLENKNIFIEIKKI